jgi:eukaryotic-like serine/threonine-protein kinase
MPLTPGSKLGPYEIVAPLGAGGMGEVWRARDTRLGRDVAIKTLPDVFARDPDRLARFEREAKLLASLSHPHIAGIYGLEEVEGHRYLVLEYVEGPTLAERLAKGPLPVGEALEICRDIAAGVEAAHESGVVHRDLKPGNVMLTPSGGVKVLDFGLAKGGSGSPGSESVLPDSPTLTNAATGAGVILGTAAYMSPEQARGKAVDRRADIWSFGCVLYECLTGKQAFEGETVSDLIAKILEREPDWTRLPAGTPPRVRELLRRCLTKDAKQRLRDIGEARVLLGAGGDAPEEATAGAALRRGVPWWMAAAGGVALAAVAVVAALQLRPQGEAGALSKFDLVAQDVVSSWPCWAALSPDGRRIAYVAKSRVWVRDLDQLEPRAIADVAGGTPLCWSPDSRTVVFNDRKKLWKAPAEGGNPMVLCEVPGTGSVLGATWSGTGTVAFASWRGGMYKVAAGGGAPVLMFDIDPKTMVDFHSPSWLAGGELLYVVHWKSDTDSAGNDRAFLTVFDGKRHIPVPGDIGGSVGSPRATATGKLLFLRQGANPGIWATDFDVAGHRMSGEPHLVAPDAATLSAADDGSLLYMEGSDSDGLREMEWVDRSGRELDAAGVAHPGLADVAIAPDGRRIAFIAGENGKSNVWVHDLARGIETRLTFGEARERRPIWTPGASRLVYVEVSDMKARVLAVNADGSGGQRELAPTAGVSLRLSAMAPDGKSAVGLVDEAGHSHLRIAPVLADGTLGPLRPLLRIQPEPDVSEAVLSPDGRLLAYATNDPGQPDVFLTRYPGGEGQWQIDADGGRRPRWANGTGELFYIAGGGPTRRALVAVQVDAAQDPPLGRATRLFEINPEWLRFGEMPYDVTADGQRLLRVRDASGREGRPRRMVLVENWEAEFARQAGK